MGGGQAPFINLIKATGLTTMALDIRRTRLFYFSKETKSIYRVSLHNHIKPGLRTYPLPIVSGWIDIVSALAVDWATGNLYWADRGYHRIMVSDSLGNFATVLHYTNIIHPQDLVIHNVDGSDPRVERSDLDGYNRVVILRGNIFYERPLALTIDYDRDV
ncbi:low density lipoprotein receptor protein [Elysia marginata]|uniref:Low density lipoprotein receptor protein n=1 Tax=Elysia marginata TaxID=1093978 RepID=A0AAV4G3J4_9GAST|nr:low density lipoprotein receptor protein [Elysia marginata]